MIWLIVDLALFAFVSIAASKTRGANFSYLALLWGVILLLSFFDFTLASLFVDYVSGFYLLAVTFTLLVVALDFAIISKMSRLLLFFMIAQAVYWLTMLLDYRGFPNNQIFSFITDNTREVAVTLAIAQIMAAFHGDTRVFTKISGYISNALTSHCTYSNRKKESQG